MKKLSLIEKAFFFKKIKIFEEIDLDVLLAVSDKVTQDDYDKNEKIFECNQKGSKLYLIAIGKVSIFDINNNFIENLEENDFLGLESIFNYNERAYTAVCIKDSLIISLARHHLLTIISEYPEVAISILKLFSKQAKYIKKKNV